MWELIHRYSLALYHRVTLENSGSLFIKQGVGDWPFVTSLSHKQYDTQHATQHGTKHATQHPYRLVSTQEIRISVEPQRG